MILLHKYWIHRKINNLIFFVFLFFLDCTYLPSCGSTLSIDCNRLKQADIQFLINTDIGIDKRSFHTITAFISNFIRDFNISSDGVRVGVASFDSSPRVHLALDEIHNRSDLTYAILHINRSNSIGENTADALDFVHGTLFTKVSISLSLSVPL